MLWTYRVVRDNQGRYSIREVFYDRDRTIIDYGKEPVTVTDASLEDLQQLVRWFGEAFELPVLELEEIQTEIDKKSAEGQTSTTDKIQIDRGQNISLQQVIADLEKDSDL